MKARQFWAALNFAEKRTVQNQQLETDAPKAISNFEQRERQ
jgi:hypothetical protein